MWQWMDTWRWHPAMNRGRHRIPLEGWRKSSQWMGLIRSHAEVFVNDTVINELFQAYCSPSNACYSGEPLAGLPTWRRCVRAKSATRVSCLQTSITCRRCLPIWARTRRPTAGDSWSTWTGAGEGLTPERML